MDAGPPAVLADGATCPPRGVLVPGTLPSTMGGTVLDARRRIYRSSRDAAACRGDVLTRRSFETGVEESICAPPNAELLAMSPDEPLLAGRAGSSLLFLSPDDSGWSSLRPGGATIERVSPPYPDPPESGPPAALTGGLAFARGGAAHLVGASEGAISVRFERGDAGRFVVASHVLEPRLTEFIDVAPAIDGGVWALGVDRGRRAFLVKLTAANTLDTNASGGFIEIDPGPVKGVIGVDGRGRVVALVSSDVGPAHLVRLEPDGRRDTTYGDNGRVHLPIGGLGISLIVERSGAVLAGGPVALADGGSHHVGVIRVEGSGALDPTFGGAAAPFLLQPGASTTDDLTDPGYVELVAAPASATSGCEPEFAVGFRQRGGAVYLFQ